MNHPVQYSPGHLSRIEDVLIELEQPKNQAAAITELGGASDDGDDDDDELSPEEEGVKCAVKNVYEGPKQCDCCTNWVDEYPEDVRVAVTSADETAHSKRHALLVRNKKSHSGPTAMVIHEVVIQSPVLKKALAVILKGYPGITFEAKEVEFSRPFKPLFYHWNEIKEAVRQHEDKQASSLLRLLFRLLKKEMKLVFKACEKLVPFSVITYDYLWTIFKPGDILFKPNDESHRMYKLMRTAYDSKTNTFDLQCKYVDWDGSKFGYGTTWESIPLFKGPRPITELPIYPQGHVKDREQVREDLISRGRKFVSLSGQHHKAYRGLATVESTSYWSRSLPMPIDGRVMIDAEAYFQYSSMSKVSLTSVPSDRKESNVGHRAQEQPSGHDATLTDDDLLICVHYARGYLLKQKKWARLNITNIIDIVWNVDVFENLILPRQYKDLILSFLESKIAQIDTFDDFIEGKGRGIIMLLSGDPGVGKTLTAESVAEKMRTPLYTVTAGELGSGIDDIEASLGKVLELAARWNAVLLLDEADVFLEQRSSHELERNKVVSVFLRILEYYKGILFLTTNRVSFIDNAFKSRIDLSINYPPLTTEAQKEIWKRFVARTSTKTTTFTDEDWVRFTNRRMNGREIKNAVKLAHLLAAKRKEDLMPSHIKDVLHVIYEDLWKEDQPRPDQQA